MVPSPSSSSGLILGGGGGVTTAPPSSAAAASTAAALAAPLPALLLRLPLLAGDGRPSAGDGARGGVLTAALKLLGLPLTFCLLAGVCSRPWGTSVCLSCSSCCSCRCCCCCCTSWRASVATTVSVSLLVMFLGLWLLANSLVPVQLSTAGYTMR